MLPAVLCFNLVHLDERYDALKTYLRQQGATQITPFGWQLPSGIFIATVVSELSKYLLPGDTVYIASHTKSNFTAYTKE